MSLTGQLKEAAYVSENVKAELRERKYFFKLTQYIAGIAGIIFGISSYFATRELLPADLSSKLFSIVALITFNYFLVKFTQIVLAFILWIAAKMTHYRVPLLQVIKSINFAYLPLWLAAPILPFITVAPEPLAGTGLYIAYIFLAIISIWSIRSLLHVMHAVLSCSIHEARFVTGISLAFIVTIFLIFT